MKSVLISIQPKWVELIASGKKTIEVRKTKPKLETPFKCYIYCTQGKLKDLGIINHNTYINRMKVVGEFVCDRIDEIGFSPYNHGEYISDIENLHGVSCVDFEAMYDYLADGYGYGWHISDLVIYDNPRDLRDFKPYNRTEDDCKFSHLGLAIPKCKDCRECYVKRPYQSWGYVESEE